MFRRVEKYCGLAIAVVMIAGLFAFIALPPVRYAFAGEAPLKMEASTARPIPPSQLREDLRPQK
jgi:hypothetical protein